MREVIARENHRLAPGPTAGKRQSWDLNSGSVLPESVSGLPKTAFAGNGLGGLGVESLSSVTTKQGHIA